LIFFFFFEKLFMQSSKYYDTLFHLKKEFTKSSLVLYLCFILVTWSLLQISLADSFENNDHVLLKIPSIYASDDGGNGNGDGDGGDDFSDESDDNEDNGDVEKVLGLKQDEDEDEDDEDTPEVLSLKDGEEDTGASSAFLGGTGAMGIEVTEPEPTTIPPEPPVTPPEQPVTPPEPPPPTGDSGINQAAALNFIRNSYRPSVQMLEEAPNFNVFWLWNDQLLSQICLKHIDPAMATTVENKMNSFGVTMRTPWATLDPQYRSNFSVNSPSEPTIQVGPPTIRYSDYNGATALSVNDYADIAFLSAIHHYYNNNLTLARQAYDAGRAMWNGQGMDDAGNITGEYAVYKVALGMLAEKITGFTPSIGIPPNWFAPFQNAQNGGITTDKTNGEPAGSQNIETTAAVLFAINPALL
jgi:hypothetical protein